VNAEAPAQTRAGA